MRHSLVRTESMQEKRDKLMHPTELEKFYEKIQQAQKLPNQQGPPPVKKQTRLDIMRTALKEQAEQVKEEEVECDMGGLFGDDDDY